MFKRFAPDQALRRYVQELTLIASCVANQRFLTAQESSSEGQTYRLRFAQPSSLRAGGGGSSGLRFDLRQVVHIVPTAALSARSERLDLKMYEYRLLDFDEKELLVYHWHPDSAGSAQPHLHVSASLNAQIDAQARRSIDLDKLHIVTGHVTLQSFIRMLITEFQVGPLRPDWEKRLDDAATH